MGVRQIIGLDIGMDIELGVGLDIGLDTRLVGFGENLEEDLEADLRENEVDLRWPRGKPWVRTGGRLDARAWARA